MILLGFLITVVLPGIGQSINLRRPLLPHVDAKADFVPEGPHRPWHPRLKMAARPDGSMVLEKKDPLPALVQIPPTFLQVGGAFNGQDACDCDQQQAHGPARMVPVQSEPPFASGPIQATADTAIAQTSSATGSLGRQPSLTETSFTSSQGRPLSAFQPVPPGFPPAANNGPPAPEMMQQGQQKANQINQLQMLSAMRQQEFNAMRAVESNLMRQQGQLQMEMAQMERQMQALGQTAQREQSLLQQAQSGQNGGTRQAAPQGVSLIQNTAMHRQPWNAPFPVQPQLQAQQSQSQAQQWAVPLQAAFPQTAAMMMQPQEMQAMPAPLPQQASVMMQAQPNQMAIQQAALPQMQDVPQSMLLQQGNLMMPQQAAMIGQEAALAQAVQPMNQLQQQFPQQMFLQQQLPQQQLPQEQMLPWQQQLPQQQLLQQQSPFPSIWQQPSPMQH